MDVIKMEKMNERPENVVLVLVISRSPCTTRVLPIYELCLFSVDLSLKDHCC